MLKRFVQTISFEDLMTQLIISNKDLNYEKYQQE